MRWRLTRPEVRLQHSMMILGWSSYDGHSDDYLHPDVDVLFQDEGVAGVSDGRAE